MCRGNATFIVLSLFLMSFCDTTSSECTQLEPCICSLPDGHYYNLTGLANTEPFVDTKADWTVFFHPCTDVNITIDNNITCGNESVSLCMYKKSGNKTQTIFGTVKETQMKLSVGEKFPIFEIHHDDSKMIIDIVCLPEKKMSFAFDPPIIPDSKTYYFTLASPYGCKVQPEMGLSTGSLLVILFFVAIGVYFIGGIIVLKTLRGATGWEMVPNHEFWFKLPSLVKDGVVFTFNCCRADTVDSYDRI